MKSRFLARLLEEEKFSFRRLMDLEWTRPSREIFFIYFAIFLIRLRWIFNEIFDFNFLKNEDVSTKLKVLEVFKNSRIRTNFSIFG